MCHHASSRQTNGICDEQNYGWSTSVESREMILKTLLAKEKAEDLDFKELATMTEGYTGSDLKVCTSTDINGELIKNLLLC